jgi:beta-N-acetylhexosaminidase
VVPRSNIAVGTVPWGLGNYVGADSVRRISATGDPESGPAAGDLEAVLAAATGRPLIAVVRDAHQYPVAQKVVGNLLSMRPDTVIVEMGLPVWKPTTPSAQVYLATFGATSASSQAAAQLLGLHE